MYLIPISSCYNNIARTDQDRCELIIEISAKVQSALIMNDATDTQMHEVFRFKF